MAKDWTNIERRPEIIFCTGSKYTGEWSPVGMCGNGIYTLPNGVQYQGEMLEGQFHGNGDLRYPDGHIIKGSWNRGSLENVIKHVFSDGLYFENINWNYCQGSDRRFQECRINGIPGVAETLILPSQPSERVTQNTNKTVKTTIGARTFKPFSFIDS